MRAIAQAAATVAAVVALWTFAAWTVFVWGGRIRNILATGGGAAALAEAVVMVAAGLGVAWYARTGRRPELVQLAVLATCLLWVFRVPLVVMHDHAVAFKAVHVVLGIVSVTLAVLAQRAVNAARGRRRAPA